MSKLAILSLNDQDIVYNNFSLFPDIKQIGYYTINVDEMSATIDSLKNKYDVFLVLNGLEDIEDYDVYSFYFHKGKDSVNGDIKILTNINPYNIIEEMIYDEGIKGINSIGYVKSVIDNIQDNQYITYGGLYTRASNKSDIYITYNALKNIKNIDISHFNIIYNDVFKYKVALCLWGHINSWKYVKTSFINNILNHVDADVFIYTYTDGNTSVDEIKTMFNDIVSTSGGRNNIDQSSGGRNNNPLRDIKIEDYTTLNIEQSTYINKLKKFKGAFSTAIDPITGTTTTEGCLESIKIVSQYRSNMLRQNYQKANNVKYDLVINCSPNLLYFNPIDLNNIKWGYIYTCYGVLCNNIDYNFYMTDPYIMDKICETLKNVHKLYESHDDEIFNITNSILLTAKDYNINIGKKIINASLQKDSNIIYKHPDKWIHLSEINYNYLYNYLYNIQDIYKIQKIKDELIR